MQPAFSVAFNVIGAFSCFRSASFLGVPAPVQLGAHLVTVCSRAVLMAPYSSEARGVKYAFYKEMSTVSLEFIAMLAFTLLDPTSGLTLNLMTHSVLMPYVACAIMLALVQMLSDIFAFQIVHHVIPYLCCHLAGHHNLQKMPKEVTQGLNQPSEPLGQTTDLNGCESKSDLLHGSLDQFSEKKKEDQITIEDLTKQLQLYKNRDQLSQQIIRQLTQKKPDEDQMSQLKNQLLALKRTISTMKYQLLSPHLDIKTLNSHIKWKEIALKKFNPILEEVRKKNKEEHKHIDDIDIDFQYKWEEFLKLEEAAISKCLASEKTPLRRRPPLRRTNSEECLAEEKQSQAPKRAGSLNSLECAL